MPTLSDFRSLSVREFGTIYEGLLETKLSVAHENLKIKKVKGQELYVPAEPGDKIAVPQGDVYLHNRSGARKSTGSYFTKPFAVEHLLDEALEPAMDAHVERLEHLRKNSNHNELSETFYDFRCADIAMGSAHFLVAAVDRIAAKLSGYLAQHPIAAVGDELAKLRKKATEALGEQAEDTKIGDDALLRRLVARRCVYGIDINPIAVELARLAVWAHTFVPGLPLSFLDHNLVCGDSLTGVGALSEAIAAIDPEGDTGHSSFFLDNVKENLAAAEPALRRLARTSDANKHEIGQSQQAHLEAQQALEAPRALFDLVSASRAGDVDLPEMVKEGLLVDDAEILRAHSTKEAQNAITWLRPVHYPTAFPEVFLRDNPGFDCIIGNPPWEQIVVKKQEWWGMHLPGIRALPVGKMNAAIENLRRDRADLEENYQQALTHSERLRNLLRTVYPQLGRGFPDYYKAFCWRTWQLVCKEGTVGLVLPRAVLQTKGSEQWRKKVLSEGTFRNVTTFVNTRGWVFDDVHGQFTVALVALRKTSLPEGPIGIQGPYGSFSNYISARTSLAEFVSLEELRSWSRDASFPQIPDCPGSLNLFRKLRRHPRFGAQLIHNSTEAQRHRGTEAQRHRGTVPLPAGPGRLQRHYRQAPVHPRQWRFRPIAELNSTADKHRFILDSTERERERDLASV